MPSSSGPQSAPQSQQPQVAVLDGVLERVTFCNPETGYTIARVAPDRGTGRGPVSAGTELVTAVGPLLGAQVGSHCGCGGRGPRTRSTAASSRSGHIRPCCPRPSRASAVTWGRG